MEAPSYTFTDLAALSVAFVSLGFVCIIPGLFLCWLGDLLDFRRRRPLMQAIISISVGIAAGPILIYWLWRYTSFAGVFTIYLVGGLFAAYFVKVEYVRSNSSLPHLNRPELRFAWGAVLVWIFVAAFSLVDLDFGDRLYPPLVIHDYGLRSFFISSISSIGIPPINPLFEPGAQSPLRYHYFWLMLCGLAEKFSGDLVDSRQSQIAGTVWSGLGLICVLVLYLRVFPENRRQNHGRRALTGIALLGVTGLDIIPVGLIALFAGSPAGSLEWWNSPVMAWVHAALWVPHHLVAVEICMSGFVVLWCAGRSDRPMTRWVGIVVAGAAFASGAGTSVYVTFVFAGFVASWIIVCFLKGWHHDGRLLIAAGLVALLLAAPYLADMTAGLTADKVSDGGGSRAGFIQFGVRPFILVDIVMLGVSPEWQETVPFWYLLTLPINYILELGFFAVAGVYWWKLRKAEQRQFSRQDLCLIVMIACGLLIPALLRSSVISNNDLGWRGPLVAQFALILLGVEIVALWNTPYLGSAAREHGDVRLGDSRLVAALLLVGVAGSVYEVVVQRIYPILSEQDKVHRLGWLSEDTRFGERTLALRATYDAVKAGSSRSATVQNNPRSYHSEIYAGLYGERKSACAITTCGAVFGGSSELAERVEPDVRAIFESKPPLPWASVTGICRKYSINVLVVSDQDGAWRDGQSWVWRQAPLVDRGLVRAFDCAAESEAAPSSEKWIN